MSWRQLLNSQRIRVHTTSKQEVDGLRSVIERDLRDATIPALSADRRFATAYNAALQSSHIAIAAAGYRVRGEGAHQTSFEALELAVGSTVSALAAYFELCRRKRNTLDYDMANVISETEAEEVLKQATELRDKVEAWIKTTHPQLA